MRLKFLSFFVFLLVVFSLLLARLVDVELIEGGHFFALAENNRYFTKKSPAERAVFLDRYGQALVNNEKQYFKYLRKDQLYSDKEFLPKEQALPLLATSSASIGHEFNRRYPYGPALASVLGYLSPITAEDLEKNPNLSMNSRLGRMGLEQYFDKNLQSKGSTTKFEINALGQTKRLISNTAPVFGENLPTSLDPYLSQLAYTAMGDKKGAVVIMDAATGQILTLISTPSFDPNVFEDHFLNVLYKKDLRPTLDQIGNYLSDERQVFFNRAVAGAYPPGSVFKLVTAIAALQEGVIDGDTVVDDQGTLKVGDFEFSNWYFTQYGRVEGVVDVKRALARSNDIFFYKVAEWLGPIKLANYARLFGLGRQTGLQNSQEASGLVPDPAWKEEERGETWYLGNTYHFGIGQGDVLVTPVQVAALTQAIANHGKLCQSSFLLGTQLNCRDLGFSEQNLEIVLSGMTAACSQGGTAYPLFAHNLAITAELDPALSESEKIERGLVACKTGTAEFGGVDERGYRKTHAWTTAIVGTPQNKITGQLKAQLEEASQSAELAVSSGSLESQRATISAVLDKESWQKLVKEHGFPEKIIITVLVESDSNKIYSEGSQDAAPVIAQILKGMLD